MYDIYIYRVYIECMIYMFQPFDLVISCWVWSPSRASQWPPGGPHILSLGWIPTRKPSFFQLLLRKQTAPDIFSQCLEIRARIFRCFFFARWFSSPMLSVVGSNCSLADSGCVERKWFGMGEVKDMKHGKWNDQDRDTQASWRQTILFGVVKCTKVWRNPLE